MFVWMAALCVLLVQTPAAQGTADFVLDLAARPAKESEALAHAGRVEWRAVFWLSQPMLRLPSSNAVEGQVAPKPR
jgi:hypothetical protein